MNYQKISPSQNPNPNPNPKPEEASLIDKKDIVNAIEVLPNAIEVQKKYMSPEEMSKLKYKRIKEAEELKEQEIKKKRII
jgi:hypothetical protein